MMRRALLAALSGACVAPTGHVATFEQLRIRRRGLGPVAPRAIVQGPRCGRDVSVLSIANRGPHLQTRFGDIARAVVAYLEAHRTEWGRPAPDLILASVKQRFGCGSE